MSVAAAIYNEALRAKNQSKPTEQTPQSSQKQSRSIIDIPDFAKSKRVYRNERNYADVLSENNTEEKRQALLVDLSKKAVDAYLEEYEKSKDQFDYSDYDEVVKMKNILDDPNFDFNKYKEQAYKLN